MTVTHYHRRPTSGYYSLERLFADVRDGMPPDVRCRLHVSRYVSLGLWPRLYNLFEAPFFQSEVNHVTGDVHYLDFFLPKRRTLLTIPDCASLERLTGWRKEMLRLFWYILPIWRAGLVSVISTATKTELLRHVRCNPAKIRIVPCCVSPVFRRNPLPFNISRPNILHIGTGKNKNLLRLAEALEGISCRLQVVGRLDEDQKAALQRHSVDYAATQDLSVEEVVAAYQKCDMVVFVST